MWLLWTQVFIFVSYKLGAHIHVSLKFLVGICFVNLCDIPDIPLFGSPRGRYYVHGPLFTFKLWCKSQHKFLNSKIKLNCLFPIQDLSSVALKIRSCTWTLLAFHSDEQDRQRQRLRQLWRSSVKRYLKGTLRPFLWFSLRITLYYLNKNSWYM